jgi:hypothetical protein
MEGFAGVTAIDMSFGLDPPQPLSATKRARGNTIHATRRSGDFISPPRNRDNLRKFRNAQEEFGIGRVR